MNYKLIIFDFDGTLADTLPCFRANVNLLAERFGFKKVTDQEFEALRAQGAKFILKELGIPMWKLPRIGSAYRNLLKQSLTSVSLFPGVDTLLRQCVERGASLAVASSNSYENVKRVLGSEIMTLIRHSECNAAMFGKQATLKKVLQKTRMPPSEAIYVGDEIRDAEAARKRGIAFAGVGWGYTHPRALEKQGYGTVCTSVRELESLLF